MRGLSNTRFDFDMSQLWLLGLSESKPLNHIGTLYQTHLGGRCIDILTGCFQCDAVFRHFISIRVTVTAARMLVALSIRHTGHLLYVNSFGSR